MAHAETIEHAVERLVAIAPERSGCRKTDAALNENVQDLREKRDAETRKRT